MKLLLKSYQKHHLPKDVCKFSDEGCVTDVTFPFLHKIWDIIILYTTFIFRIFNAVSIQYTSLRIQHSLQTLFYLVCMFSNRYTKNVCFTIHVQFCVELPLSQQCNNEFKLGEMLCVGQRRKHCSQFLRIKKKYVVTASH